MSRPRKMMSKVILSVPAFLLRMVFASSLSFFVGMARPQAPTVVVWQGKNSSGSSTATVWFKVQR